MIEERDSIEDNDRWNYFYNHPSLIKRDAFRLFNKGHNLSKKQKLLIKELFKND